VGKIKEAFYRDAIAELMKRMGRYATTEVIEVAEEKAPEGLSQAEKEQILANEGERLLGKTDERDHIIALCIEGKKLTSEAFAAHIRTAMLAGKSRIVFIIGSSFGLHPSVKRRADMLLSFSDMTFPHQLFRVMLAEQIYRAFKINNNEPYHK
jgi:23S rRNA (pseudouridine1915-N3)-methyltransferase